MKNSKSIKQDKKYIWHSFTQHKIYSEPIKIVSGRMSKLKDDKVKYYLVRKSLPH